MGIHDGHRERLRESFLRQGLDGMSDINVLELLLFYAIPRRDTNETAHLLLKRFGSLDKVFSASYEELCDVEGIGRNAASLIVLIPQIVKRSRLTGKKKIRLIRNSEDAREFFLPYFMFEQNEVLYLLCLDSKRAVLACTEMGRGTVNAVDANIRRIAEKALQTHAVSTIIAHNHPGGVAAPSREDEFFTRGLYNALETVGILLEDHIIVAEEETFSFADADIMPSGK